MEVSTEISQKIRSAIKAKLMELGAYVDDELPDYIMVMVANKRSRAQMNKDLGLFLGTNTSSFTEWLHSLLGKLQTIRSDLDKSADKQGKGGRLKAVKEKGDKEEIVDGLHSIAKQEKTTFSAGDCSADETQPDSGSGEENKYKNAGDSSKEAGSSVKSASLKSENDDVRPCLFTDTTPTDAISEEGDTMTMETEVVNARPLPLGTEINITLSKGSSASHSPGHGQSRKRKTPSDLADVSQESDDYHHHPYNPAFDSSTTSGLTTDKLPTLQVTRHTHTDASEETTHDAAAELPEHDGRPPEKLIRLAESVQLEDIKRALSEVLEKNSIQNDDIAHFSKMLESSLRKLRPQDLSVAKLRIQQILCEFENAAVQEENLVGNHQNARKAELASCLRNDSKCNSFGKYSRCSVTDSRSVLQDKHSSSTSPQTDSSLSQKKERNQNSEREIDNTSVSGHLVDSLNIFRPRSNSGGLENHLTVTCEYSSSDSRVNSQPHESHVEKVVFHSKAVNSQKSSDAAECPSKVADTVVKFRDKESALVKNRDQSPQSPVSLGKADIGSPSSVHSCPLTSTLSLRVKRNVSSASRESTVSPVDLQSKPGTSHITRTKHASAKNKILPSILVDSIHSRKRSESSESASVLRQSLSKDRSPRPVDSSKQDIQESSPRHYGPEALKVMAKNLRITVINKRAVKSPQESSSDDSDDEEDEDSSDNDDDEEEEDDAKVKNSGIAKVKTSTAAQKKAISHHSSLALLLQAVADVEHSIAIKRIVTITKPVCRDGSPSEEYSPKRKWSHDCVHEDNPPPYIPSRKPLVDQSSHSDGFTQSNETRHLRHDSKCTQIREDCRELISRYRREELLRTIGIVRDSSERSQSLKSLTRDSSCQEGGEKFTCKREVRGDNSFKNIQNFQITAHLVSPDLQHLASGLPHSQVEKHHPHPEPRQSLHVIEGSVSCLDSRTSITSRLGKLVVERKDSLEDDVLEAGNSTTGYLLSSAKLRDTIDSIDATETPNLMENLTKKYASISSVHQKQDEADSMSVETTHTSKKPKKQRIPRSVNRGVFRDACSRSRFIEDTARSPEGIGVALKQKHSQEALPGMAHSSALDDSDNQKEDGTVEDQKPVLLDKNYCGDCTFGIGASDTNRRLVEGHVKKHEKVGERQGITFIVTLDGVDESQFGSENIDEVQSGCEVVKSRQSGFKAHAGRIENTGSRCDKVKCVAVSTSVPVTPVVTSDLKKLYWEQKLLLDLETKVVRPEPPMLLQQVQSLNWAANDPSLLPLESQPALLGLKGLDGGKDDIASVPRVGHCYSSEDLLDEEGGLSSHQQSKLERCKFWPACAAGGSCGYYHPTIHCKIFPNCRFGDKCLFIHPNCRFDSRCARPDCPYTHSSRRQPAHVVTVRKSHFVLPPSPQKPHFLGPAYTSSESACRYFPNCQNMNCPFVHPKPCRFGLACKNPSCSFFHPYVPDKRVLKWQTHSGKLKGASLNVSGQVKTIAFTGAGTSKKPSYSATVTSTSQ